MENKFIRLKEVLAKTSLSRSGLYKKIQNGDFPQSISIGARSVAWNQVEICSWIDEKIHLSRLQQNNNNAVGVNNV